MIIIVSHDDRHLAQVAQQQSQQNHAIFGQCYQAFTHIPPLGANENLFITAHGAYSDAGSGKNPVIGDEQKDHFYNAVEFYHNIQTIFPNNYQGNVYISACETANSVKGSFSFAEVFKTQIQVRHNRTKVFGQKGGVAYNIPAPNDHNWVEA